MASEAANTAALESAFDAFNQHSTRLEHAYRDLQVRFADLSSKLDATRRTATAQTLENERISNRLLSLLEALPAAVIIIDSGGVIRECNHRASSLLSVPLIGVAWSVVVQRDCCRGASRDGELKLKCGRWLSLSRQSLFNEGGEILLLAAITESRGNAEMLERADRLASIGEMTASFGHQIRTPLASALLYADSLQKSVGPEQQEVATHIVRRLRDLSGMVDDMLHYAGGATRSGQTVSVSRLLEDAVETIAPQLQSGTRIKIETADDNLQVNANRDALKGALLNLLTNSIQSCDEDPVIELSAVQTRDMICLTVSDNGSGISADIRDRIFEPFFTTRPQGTGLGLAVVRAVAKAHGGEVLLDDSGSGASISICLPILDANAADDREADDE